MHVDVHQHVWPDGFIQALRRRSQPPHLDGWTLHTAGEPPFEVDPADHDPGRCAARAARDGVGLVVVGLSSPLGVEYLPTHEAEPLLDAYHRGITGLGAPFIGWAATCLTEIDPRGLAKQLDLGFAGLQLPATAVADESGYHRYGPLLDVLAGRDRPLFIHPGPARNPGAGGHHRGAEAEPGGHEPSWWAPMVPYLQQLHAAWFAFAAYGRLAYPRLRVCFAALAGLAPLHGERMAARGGTDPLARGAVDPLMFAETSSYGNRAVDSMLRVLGVDQLVFGTDQPYQGPHPGPDLGDAARHALRVSNPARLLHGDRLAPRGHDLIAIH